MKPVNLPELERSQITPRGHTGSEPFLQTQHYYTPLIYSVTLNRSTNPLKSI